MPTCIAKPTASPSRLVGSAPVFWRAALAWGLAGAVALLAGCATRPPAAFPTPSAAAPVKPKVAPAVAGAAWSGPLVSRWTPANWSDLPGFEDDSLPEAWNAWLRSCERPSPVMGALCHEVRPLSLATAQERRDWMRQRLQPYRVESLRGEEPGLLTGYYEPVLHGSRVANANHAYPLYAMPPELSQNARAGKPWYSRQELDTLPEARAAVAGRELLWLSQPLEVLTLQIQGSGRVQVQEPDGSLRWVRLSYAGSNNHPYRSPGRWLLDQRAIQDASWPGIKTWLTQNPNRMQEFLWSNPRVVFFREDPLSELDASSGPTGAQGVALTPGRSIAVDPTSIPYGTPVWLATSGNAVTLQKLVLAQDTGAAITGAVRADYFTGWDAQAAELAGRLKQPLQMWVLWPK